LGRPLVATLVVGLIACGAPTKPSTSIASAQPVSPTTGTQVSYYSQPVTIVIANGVATGNTLPSTIIELATDAAFTKIVTTKAASLDAASRVSISVDHLSPATTYYWRAKTSAGDNLGIYSSTSVTSFRTASMFDGVYRYFLTLRLPPVCPDGPAIILQSLQWDDGLYVNGERLTFLLSYPPYPSSLDLNLTRTGDTVTGTIGGSAGVTNITHLDTAQKLWYGPPVPAPASTTGTARPAGRFEGAFHGDAVEENYANPTFRCFDKTFQWTLEPHS
jgi:hypothetical protein